MNLIKMKKKLTKGISIVEALVCMVIIGIGFIAMLQLSAFSISSADRAIERNKMNFLSEMVLDDMIGDPYNSGKYSGFSSSCSYTNPAATTFQQKQKNKWRKTLFEKDFIKFDKGSGYKDKKPVCHSTDSKKTFVNTKKVSGADSTSGRINFFTNKGKTKKFLGVIIK